LPESCEFDVPALIWTFELKEAAFLCLKGLVLFRDIRRRVRADADELDLYSAEIARVRDRLADLIPNGGGGVERPAA
jgi:hypothetical protein